MESLVASSSNKRRKVIILAFADKITTMQRVVLIKGNDKSDFIIYEGVKIEGEYLLKKLLMIQ